jgi:hypothetical protein
MIPVETVPGIGGRYMKEADYSHLLVYMSGFVPEQFCFDFYSFVDLGIRYCDATLLFFL